MTPGIGRLTLWISIPGPTTSAMDEGLPVPQRRAAATTSVADVHLKLMTFFSPAFPVGSFAYSHGLELLIAEGRIAGSATLMEWLADLLRSGGLWNDAVLLAEAFDAACVHDAARLDAVAELSSALPTSRERHLETTAQGRAFLNSLAGRWRSELTDSLCLREVGLPVAVGAACGVHAIPIEAALAAYLNASCATLVSVAVRLVPLGQTAGIVVLGDLHPVIAEILPNALASSLADLGSAAILSDIAAMRHETLYSRVFRT